jgi:hypothetical protein
LSWDAISRLLMASNVKCLKEESKKEFKLKGEEKKV